MALKSIKSDARYESVKSRYGTLTVFSNDSGAATRSLLTYGEWAQNEISFLQQFITSGCTVLDIGAYVGTHTLAFANFVGPTGRVIAIEAQPDTFEILQKNVAANVPASTPGIVQLQNAVVSYELGQVTIPTIDIEQENSFGSASLLDILTNRSLSATGNEATMPGCVPMPVITVDSLDLQNCALIKVDVEGVEEMVLRGAVQTLERCSPFVYCECNSLVAGLKTVAVLERAKYKVFAHVVNAFNVDNFFKVQKNIFNNGREIALLGVPEERVAYIKDLPIRPFELLLNIEDADDLALALLNKPQYQSEVLRVSHAAKTGGVVFLDQYDEVQMELGRLQNENAALHRLRIEECRALEQRVQVYEEKLASISQKDNDIAELRSLVTQRDADIIHLHAQVSKQDREIAELHSLLTQRDTDIELLHVQLSKQSREIAELHNLLTQRDTDIVRLHAQANLRDREAAELQDLLTQRGADIARLVAEVTVKDGDLLLLNALISNLYSSKSWRITKPLRWVTQQIRRLRARAVRIGD